MTVAGIRAFAKLAAFTVPRRLAAAAAAIASPVAFNTLHMAARTLATAGALPSSITFALSAREALAMTAAIGKAGARERLWKEAARWRQWRRRRRAQH